MGVNIFPLFFVSYFAVTAVGNTLRDDYEREGFVIIEDFASPEEVVNVHI